ncbi:MAG: hypothetical protein CSYNP_00789 [Syntrophus sp. SKADARSKE-3]|nr:hypothetical protein [Syntrophus sp. SKADARSKE-3]
MKTRPYVKAMITVFVLSLVLSGSAFAAELSARMFSGEVKSARSGRIWTPNLKINNYDSLSGNFEGQIEWPSLNSIHKIEGQIIGARFTFKETQAIRSGGAHLNCEYAGIIVKDTVEGNWIDNDSDQGTFRLSAKSSGKMFNSGATVDSDLLINFFTGEVRSTRGGVWKANLRFTVYDPASGNLEGELEWPSLNSIHKISGRMMGNRISFKEVDYIKRGSAHLNCEYTARYERGVMTGKWVEPGADQGDFQFSKK